MSAHRHPLPFLHVAFDLSLSHTHTDRPSPRSRPLIRLSPTPTSFLRVITVLQRITCHPHPREVAAHVATILLDYFYSLDPFPDGDAQDSDQDDDAHVRTSAPPAIADLFRRGTSGETAGIYLGRLHALRESNSSQSHSPAPASVPPPSSLAGTKRKAGSAAVTDFSHAIVLDRLGADFYIPSAPTILPVLIEIEVHLVNADPVSAIELCRTLEASPAPSVDEKRKGFYRILNYLYECNMLFDDSCAEEQGEESFCDSSLFHLLQVGTVSISAIKSFLANLCIRADDEAAQARLDVTSALTSDEIASARECLDEAEDHLAHLQFHCQRTMLKFLLNRDYSPAAALREAEAVVCAPPSVVRESVSYVGVGRGGNDCDGHALGKIRAILSNSIGSDEVLPMNDPRLGRAVSYEPSVEQRDEEGIEGAGFGTSENEVVLLESSDAEDVVAASAEEEEEEEEEERGGEQADEGSEQTMELEQLGTSSEEDNDEEEVIMGEDRIKETQLEAISKDLEQPVEATAEREPIQKNDSESISKATAVLQPNERESPRRSPRRLRNLRKNDELGLQRAPRHESEQKNTKGNIAGKSSLDEDTSRTRRADKRKKAQAEAKAAEKARLADQKGRAEEEESISKARFEQEEVKRKEAQAGAEAKAAEKARLEEKKRRISEEENIEKARLEQEEVKRKEAEAEAEAEAKAAEKAQLAEQKRRAAEEEAIEMARLEQEEVKRKKAQAEAEAKAVEKARLEKDEKRRAAEEEAAEKARLEHEDEKRKKADGEVEATDAVQLNQETTAVASKDVEGTSSGLFVARAVKSVMKLLSPKSPKKKPSVVIDLLDASEDDSDEEENNNGSGDEITKERIESLTYREMQRECRTRNLPATGKSNELRQRLFSLIKIPDVGEVQEKGITAKVKQELKEAEVPKQEIAVKLEETSNQTKDQHPADITVNSVAGPPLDFERDGLSKRYISDLKYHDLQKECAMRNIPAKGKGEDIRQRLFDFVSNGYNSEPVAADISASNEGNTDAIAAVSSAAADNFAAQAPSMGTGVIARLKGVVLDTAYYLSPKAAKKTKLEVIDLMSDSDDEDAAISPAATPLEKVKEEETVVRHEDDKTLLSAQEIDGMSYRQLQSECKIRNLRATGKGTDLKERLMETIKNQQNIPTAIGGDFAAPSPMSSLASTPGDVGRRVFSRTTPSSTGVRRQRGEGRGDCVAVLPAVSEENEIDIAGSIDDKDRKEKVPASTRNPRQGRRKREEDDKVTEKASNQNASPKRKQKRKAIATPASTYSRRTRSSARTTRSSTRSNKRS